MSKARLRDSTLVIAPTNKVRNKLKNYDIIQDIKVIPSGIDLSKFNIAVTEKDILEFREKYNIPENAKILLYLGRLGKEKNIIQLLDYFKQLVKDKDDIVLLLVGGGPFQSEVENAVKEQELITKEYEIINIIKQYKELVESGAITEEEFEDKKKSLLLINS